MFEVSLRWQDGAIQLGIYTAVIVAVLFVMSRIPSGGESSTRGKKGKE